MGKQTTKQPVIGTKGNVTFYRWRGNYYLRAKSTLSGDRVKHSPAFAKTMMHANRLAQASRIASTVYQALPAKIKKRERYVKLTGQAIQLLKDGLTNDEVKALLHQSSYTT